MIPLAVPNIGGNELKYLTECIETTFVSSVGPFVTRLEERIAAVTKSEAATATCSGTTGLHAALTAIGVKPDDLVIAPSFTFIATPNAIHQAGAAPWLFDMAEESWTLDPDLLKTELAAKTEKTAKGLVHTETGRTISAILPVYTLGCPADMDHIRSTAERYGLPIVADAAAALGARYRGQEIGEIGADLSVASFNGNKTVTAGGGGAVFGNKEAVDKVRHLATTARTGPDYDHDIPGFNYRMTNLEAAVGVAQLERLDEFLAAKRAIHKGYLDRLAGHSSALAAPPDPEWADSAYWMACVLVSPEIGGQLGDVRTRLREKGVDARPFWKPAHLQAPYVDAPRTEMTVTDIVWSRVLTLPCSTHLSSEEQDTVADTLLETLREIGASS